MRAMIVSEGPRPQIIRFLGPNATIKLVFGPESPIIWVLGPLESGVDKDRDCCRDPILHSLKHK